MGGKYLLQPGLVNLRISVTLIHLTTVSQEKLQFLSLISYQLGTLLLHSGKTLSPLHCTNHSNNDNN
jgi:hypothetical protein